MGLSWLNKGQIKKISHGSAREGCGGIIAIKTNAISEHESPNRRQRRRGGRVKRMKAEGSPSDGVGVLLDWSVSV
jgi:hypothetical protein